MKKVLLVLLAALVLTSCGYMEDARLKRAEKAETLRINDSIKNAKAASEIKARELEKAEAKAKKEKTIDSLKVNFDIKVDEFTGIGWVRHKKRAKYVNENGIEIYFQIDEDGKSKNLRFRVQYTSKRWLFFDKVRFSVNVEGSEAFRTLYYPKNKKRDNDSTVWEWFDDSVSTSEEKIFIALLSNSKTAKMRLSGSTKHVDKTITKSQIKAINQTLRLYEAMQ